MENRLELNKKPRYELPDEVLVGLYMNKYQKVNFEPDVCLCVWGVSVGKLSKPREYAKQIWVKTDNEELINFIKRYNWNKEAHKMTAPNLNMWRFKKIILEEYYGGKYEK